MQKLLLADSFRVRTSPINGEAEVRGLGHHFTRFSQTASESYRSMSVSLDSFLNESRERIAAYGEGFPRLELWQTSEGAVEFKLSLRPLPELSTSIALRVASHIEIQYPERKGPNIDVFALLNRELDAEALLLDEQGFVLEGTTTSLIWWVNGRLHRVENQKRVASVTEALVAEVAANIGALGEHDVQSGGTTVSVSKATPIELANYEVWAVNALHGIRVVRSIDDAVLPPSDIERLSLLRGALDQTWQRVR